MLHPLQQNALEIRRRLLLPAGGRRSDEIEILPQYRVEKERFKLAEKARLAKRRQDINDEIESARVAYAEMEAARRIEDPDPPPKTPTIRFIIARVCEFYRITEPELLAYRRTSDVVRLRQIAMYLAKTLTLRPLPEIGRRFGRDHTTVLHAARKIAARIPRDPALAAEISELKKILVAE